MLTSFTIKRTFYETRVSLYVDCEAKTADCLVTYDRRIVRQEGVPFWQTDTPEKAAAWLSETVGVEGSRLETLHAINRRQAA